jgi:hypothetical protein
MGKIDSIRLGIAGGMVTSFLIFVLTLLCVLSGFGQALLELLKNTVFGFEITVFGSLIGALYGFIIGFIEMFFIAFIYNILGSDD